MSAPQGPVGMAAVASGDNLTGHVIATSATGAAIASVLSWILQMMHVLPPPDVVAALGVICTVAASYLSQHMGPKT